MNPRASAPRDPRAASSDLSPAGGLWYKARPRRIASPLAKEMASMDIWLVAFGCGALLLQAGIALQASGLLRAKNAASAVTRVAANLAVTTLLFWAIGAALLLQQANGWIGFDTHLLLGVTPDRAGSVFFQLAVVLIGPAVVAGALAERSRFYVSVLLAAVLGGVVIPVIGHWTWLGWLKQWGFVDVGGATAVHVVSAVFAAVAAAVVGPRVGKFNKDSSSNSIPGHALPLSSAGVLLLVVGWLCYLLGSALLHGPAADATGAMADPALGLVAMNVLLAAAAGAVAALLYSQFRYAGHADIFFIFSGMMGGLVAISAGVTAVGNVGAVLIGAVAGLLVPLVSLELDQRFKLDDPIGLVSIFGIGGVWGTLAVGLFSAEPLGAEGRLRLLGVQAVGLLAAAVVAAVAAGVVLALLRLVGPLRVVDTDEFDGLDIGEHDINAYPDFQQTMIKSYHLREA